MLLFLYDEFGLNVHVYVVKLYGCEWYTCIEQTCCCNKPTHVSSHSSVIFTSDIMLGKYVKDVASNHKSSL